MQTSIFAVSQQLHQHRDEKTKMSNAIVRGYGNSLPKIVNYSFNYDALETTSALYSVIQRLAVVLRNRRSLYWCVHNLCLKRLLKLFCPSSCQPTCILCHIGTGKQHNLRSRLWNSFIRIVKVKNFSFITS